MRWVSTLLMSALVATAAAAQQEHTVTVSAYEFVARDSTVRIKTDAYDRRYVEHSEAAMLVAPLRLPDGAVVIGFEPEYCQVPGEPLFQLELRERCHFADESCRIPSRYETFQNINSVGCFRYPVSINLPVDNEANRYQLEAVFGAGSATRLAAVRVYYRTPLPQAPETATFVDVPVTHPFFEFIEALYTAGATAGCGNQRFCPDLFVTRAQLSAILAGAFGRYRELDGAHKARPPVSLLRVERRSPLP